LIRSLRWRLLCLLCCRGSFLGHDRSGSPMTRQIGQP
jgi:hypothetical protein